MTVCAAVYRNLAVLAAEALAFTQALGRLGERGRAPAMRSTIDFAVLPSVSLALAHADAVAAVAVAALHHDVAVLAREARARADAFIAPSDCAVLAAVNLTALTAISVALASAVEVVATRSMSATDDTIAEVSLAVFASVSFTLADTLISRCDSAMLSAVDIATSTSESRAFTHARAFTGKRAHAGPMLSAIQLAVQSAVS